MDDRWIECVPVLVLCLTSLQQFAKHTNSSDIQCRCKNNNCSDGGTRSGGLPWLGSFHWKEISSWGRCSCVAETEEEDVVLLNYIT